MDEYHGGFKVAPFEKSLDRIETLLEAINSNVLFVARMLVFIFFLLMYCVWKTWYAS